MFTATRNHGVRGLLVAGFAALTLSIAATGAHASPTVDTSRITVRYGELDLAKPAGARALYRLIQQAAFDVCDGYVGRFSEMQTRRSACYKDAIANAVAAVGSPQLTALYGNSRTKLAAN